MIPIPTLLLLDACDGDIYAASILSFLIDQHDRPNSEARDELAQAIIRTCGVVRFRAAARMLVEKQFIDSSGKINVDAVDAWLSGNSSSA